MKRLLAFSLLLLFLFVAGCNNKLSGDHMIMQAKIIEVYSDNSLLVEIIQDDYNNGEMCVLTSNKTTIKNVNGEKIAFSNLTINSVINIEYSGQVMLSYPAKINAIKITLV